MKILFQNIVWGVDGGTHLIGLIDCRSCKEAVTTVSHLTLHICLSF